ncbi:hypothetical protein [Streptomyces sp. HM190]|uniref:hypothetical protein n=1 Tax=Streptomyces sp. HM190 TaxID=2695266 RepID=UPI00135C27B7|nr:hypothetical protein [Streptomyces sp. HM190]
MHRPTTTATLLVTVAVSALTGCVTTHRPPPPGTPPAPSQSSQPRPDGTTETQVVQAPAREALELIGPSRRPTPGASSPPPGPAATSAPDASTPTAPAARRERPAPPRRPGPPPASRPRVEIPPIPEAVPTGPRRKGDVCALGHKYGGWGKDTPQAVICRDVYGH